MHTQIYTQACPKRLTTGPLAPAASHPAQGRRSVAADLAAGEVAATWSPPAASSRQCELNKLENGARGTTVSALELQHDEVKLVRVK
jgi:hypothetical protein